MLRKIASRALVTCVALLCTLLLLEFVVRVGGEESSDGQFTFSEIDLQPYALPLHRLTGQINQYLDNVDLATLIYDELVGWRYRPDSSRYEGGFTINSAGLRSKRNFEVEPPADTLRIAVFGDSFTAGEDVNDEGVWSHLLEVNLNQNGFRTEVLNFGVSAYGMDQAYLLWQHHGREYAPDIVIFGLQAENLDRNVNVFRQLIHPMGSPFSKPRYILDDTALQLVNSPAIPPHELIATFKSFESHPLSVHEAYYRSRDFEPQWWSGSRLASLAFELLNLEEEDEQIAYGPDSERGLVGKAIVDAFAADVLADGTPFIIVFLPHRDHIRRTHSGEKPPYAFLLEYLEDRYRYIALDAHLGPEYMEEQYWGLTLHYGPEINRIASELIAGDIIECIESLGCPLSRIDDLAAIRIAAAESGG